MASPLVVDLSDPDFWQDPHAVWRDARRHGPTARTTKGELVLMNAADFDVVHTDVAFGQMGLDALERLGIHDGPFHAWRARTMAAHDGDLHARLRTAVARSFTPRRVEPFRAALQTHAADVIRQATDHGSIDVVTEYANDLPLWLICEFLGLPQTARSEIDAFLTGTEAGFTDPPTPESRRRADEGITALSDYVEGLIAQSAADPGEDLVSDLLESESSGVLSREELIALVVNVIGGSVGSSRAGIANSILLLLQHPDQAEWMLATPERIRPAIEECIRYQPPFRTGRRKVLAPTEQFGVDLRPGDTVLLARQAANRDPARWSEPDRFDVTRPEQRHYSFGWGAHFCLGNALARLDIQVAVSAFLRQLGGAQLVERHPRRIPFTADEQLASLVVTLGAPGGSHDRG
jgi:cytochrome P450